VADRFNQGIVADRPDKSVALFMLGDGLESGGDARSLISPGTQGKLSDEEPLRVETPVPLTSNPDKKIGHGRNIGAEDWENHEFGISVGGISGMVAWWIRSRMRRWERR